MFIRRILPTCISREIFSIQRAFPTYQFHTYSLESQKEGVSPNIQENITEKINSLQFKSLKEDIFNSTHATSYQNTEVLRLIILKSIQKKNLSFASEVFGDMVRLNIVPDDATYTSLMDTLLYEGDTEDAFELYIHAYLNNVTLDLEIFHSLLERLRKKDISYTEVAYKILKTNLIPSKYIYDHVVNLAQKAKATEFLKVLNEDMEKYEIGQIDDPKVYKESRSSFKKRKNNNRDEDAISIPLNNKKRPPLLVIPLNMANNRSIQREDLKEDGFIKSFLEDLANSIQTNKFRGGPYLYDEVSDDEDEEYESDESDEGDSEEASESEEGSEESDSDNEKNA